MVARKPGRYLAPVALIAVLVAVILVVRARTDGGHRTTTTPPPAHQTSVSHPTAPAKSFYVIKAGDTLSGISVKTKVSIATLESLNPSLNNPNALQTGERIRLR
jgi:LysM repeat protein